MGFIIVALLLVSNFALGKVSKATNVLETYDCQVRGDVAQLFLTTNTSKTLITESTVFYNTAPTFFVIHGWTESSVSKEYREIANALYIETLGNVIMVDYKEIGAKSYACARIITQKVGNFVSYFISNQTKANNMHPSRIYIIGHSLGGQIAGYIGCRVEHLTDSKIARISGLDPAGPLFTVPLLMPIPWLSLSFKDAVVVDVLHTTLLLGTYGRTGSVDFYVQGIFFLPLWIGPCKVNFDESCTHQLSKTLFRESIQSCGLVGINFPYFSCKAVYGFHMPLNTTGVYALNINHSAPYGKSKPGCN